MPSDVLAPLVRSSAPRSFDDVRAFLAQHADDARAIESPVDRAIAGGAIADRLGFAFAAGYAAALDALLGARVALTALAATEQGGAHPRAIATRLDPSDDGWILRGEKTFVTLASLVETMLVVARVPSDADRPSLAIARVPVAREGVRVVELDALPFVPEIPHGIAFFEDVRVARDEILEGDGYTRYLKPFRTIEDVHVHAALFAYLSRVGTRARWPAELREQALISVMGARALASEDPSSPAVHLALAGLLRQSQALVAAAEPHWAMVETDERERWARDRRLLAVAGKVREARRARAWERVGGSGGEP
jgi:acyl-CoA dehydrogenase